MTVRSLLLLLVLVPVAPGCASPPHTELASVDIAEPRFTPLAGARAATSSEHVALGVPTDDDPADDFLMDKGVYYTSYNPLKRVPNWVSWKLSSRDMGSTPRQNRFRTDRDLPAAFVPATTGDYLRSGFDRGHLCPSAHRTRTLADNSLTFLLTNIQPQDHALNDGPWRSLEAHERALAQARKDLYIVAGGVFTGNDPSVGSGVAIPAANFRVVVVTGAGTAPLTIGATAQIIAVIMPNDRTAAGHAWTDYAVTVRDVEAASGYRFFASLPAPVRAALTGTD